MRRPSPWVLLGGAALVLAVAGVVGEFSSELGGDAAALLYAAGRILDGTSLYRGLIDLNPPFTFLFHIPFAAAARITGTPPALTFRIGLLLATALVGAVLLLVLRRSAFPDATRSALISAFLLASTGLAISFFGEREHIQIVFMFPYLCLATSRGVGGRASPTLSALAGSLAGIGLALKVTAGLVPVLVAAVLWLGWRRRSDESFWALGVAGLVHRWRTALGAWLPGGGPPTRWVLPRFLGGTRAQSARCRSDDVAYLGRADTCPAGVAVDSAACSHRCLARGAGRVPDFRHGTR